MLLPPSDPMRPLLFFVLLLAAPLATAQSNTTGLYLNARLGGVGSNAEVELADDVVLDLEEGGGSLDLAVGYGVSPAVTLFARVQGAAFDGRDDLGDYGVAFVDLGARLHFGAGQRRLVPYAEAALTGHSLSFDNYFGLAEDLTASGGAFTLGGGVQYFLSPSVALDAGIGLSLGRLDQYEAGRTITGDVDVESDLDDVSLNSFRIGLGVALYPFR